MVSSWLVSFEEDGKDVITIEFKFLRELFIVALGFGESNTEDIGNFVTAVSLGLTQKSNRWVSVLNKNENILDLLLAFEIWVGFFVGKIQYWFSGSMEDFVGEGEWVDGPCVRDDVLLSG